VNSKPNGVIRCPLEVQTSWAYLNDADGITSNGVQLSTDPGLSSRNITVNASDVEAQDNSGVIPLAYFFYLNHPLAACTTGQHPDTHNCDGYVTAGSHPFQLDLYGPATTHIIRYEARDRGPLGDGSNPNIGQCDLTVVISDTERPVLTCPADQGTGAAGGLATDTGRSHRTLTIGNDPHNTANCSDNVGCGAVTARYGAINGPVISGAVHFNLSSYGSSMVHQVFFVATDEPCAQCEAVNGVGNSQCTSVCFNRGSQFNQGNCTMTINVTDTEPPVLACPTNVRVGTDCAANCTPTAGSCVCASVGRSYATLPVLSANVTDNSGMNVDYVAYIGAFAGSNASNVIGSGLGPTNHQYSIGNHTVVYRAQDSLGNVGSCSLVVTVVDAEDPVLVCPANISVSTDAGQAFKSYPQMPTPTTISDNSGNPMTPVTTLVSWTSTTSTVAPAAYSTPGTILSGPVQFYIGTTVVQYSVSDSSGRTTTCNIHVTVADTENPRVCCPGQAAGGGCPQGGASPSLAVNTDPGASGPPGRNYATQTLVGSQATASDNSGVNGTISMGIVAANGAVTPVQSGTAFQFPIGSTTVRYSTFDESSNSGFCDITVVVSDVEAPVLTCPPNIVVNTTAPTIAGTSGSNSAIVTVTAATVADNSGASLTVNGSYGQLNYTIGSHTLVYSARDGAGNAASCSVNITVEDNEAPVLTCPPNIAFELNSSVSYLTLDLSQNYSGTYNGYVVSGNTTTSTSRHVIGLATITDNNNLVATPVVSARATINGVANSLITSGAHRFGCCASSPTLVTFSATDVDGNVGTCSMTVTVRDIVPPTLTCNVVPSVFTCGNTQACTLCRPPSVTVGSATDCGLLQNRTACQAAGSNNWCTWNAALQSCGFTNPTAGCNTNNPGDRPYHTMQLPGPMITDNSGETLTAVATIFNASRVGGNLTGAYSYSPGSPYLYVGGSGGLPSTGTASNSIYNHRFYIGQTRVQFTATDSEGNVGTCMKTVTVIDNEDPIIIGAFTNNNGIQYCVPSQYLQYPTDPGAYTSNVSLALLPTFDNSGSTQPQSAFRSCDPAINDCTINPGAIARHSTQPGQLAGIAVPISQLSGGDTLVYFKVEDHSANDDICVLELRVVDVERPTISCPPDFVVSTRAMNLTGGGVTADSALVVIPSANVTDNSCGLTPPATNPTWNCQNDLMVYGTNPAATVPTAAVHGIQVAGIPTIQLIANGGSADLVIGTSLSTRFFTPYHVGYGYNFKVDGGQQFTSYNITFSSADSAGNVATCSLNLQVADNLPPIVTCPNNINSATVANQNYADVSLPRVGGNGGPTATDNSLPAAQYVTLRPFLVPSGGTVQNLCAANGVSTALCQSVPGCRFNSTTSSCERTPGTFWFGVVNQFLRIQPAQSACGGAASYNSRTQTGCQTGALCDLDGLCGNAASGTATPITSRFYIGTHYVFYTVVDTASNIGSCITTVTIQDQEPPVVHCPADYTGSRSLTTASGTFYRQVLLDVLRDSITSKADSNGAPCTTGCPHPCQNNNPCVTDNSQTQYSAIPSALETVICGGAVTTNCGGWPYQAHLPAAWTAYNGGTVLVNAVNLGRLTQQPDTDLDLSTMVFQFPIGLTKVTYTATDDAGLLGTCVQHVEVRDTEPPVLTCPTVMACGSPVSGAVTTCYGDSNSDYATVAIVWGTDISYTENSRAPLQQFDARFTRSFHPGSVAGTNTNSPTLASTNSNVHNFPFGQTTIQYFARDAVGNEGTCSVNLVVLDNEPPVISCPAISPTNTDTNRSYATISISVGSIGVFDQNKYDNQLTAAQRQAQDILFAHAVYNLTTLCTGVEVCNASIDCSTGFVPGNASSCATGCNYTAPGTCIPADYYNCANADISGPPAASATACTAAGSCNYTNTQCLSAGTCRAVGDPCVQELRSTTAVQFGIGQNAVDYVAKDSHGNVGRCTVSIVVVDAQPPVLVCPPDLAYSSDPGQSFNLVDVNNATAFTSIISVSDNSETAAHPGRTSQLVASVRPEVNGVPLSGLTQFHIGTTQVIFKATDQAGNNGTCALNVVVTDVETPVLTCPPDQSIFTNPPTGTNTVGSAVSTHTLHYAVVVDNSGLNLTGFPAVAAMCTATNWTNPYDVSTCASVTALGNSSACLAVAGSVCTYSPRQAATATTAPSCTGGSTCAAVSSLNDDTACLSQSGCSYVPSTFQYDFRMGNSTVIYSAVDSGNNTGTCQMTITVADNEMPVLSCPPNQNLVTDFRVSFASVAFSGLLSNLTLQDNSGESLTPRTDLFTGQAGGPFSIGTTLLTFLTTDRSGNTGQCSLNITVRDAENPQLACPANITQSADYGQNFATVFLPGPINATCVATNTSISADVATCGTVTALDNSSACDLLPVCTYLATTVIDNSGADLSSVMVAKLTATGAVFTNLTQQFPLGNSSVTYQATDAAGNTGTCTYNVLVQDNQLPFLTCPSDVFTSTDPPTPGAAVGSPYGTVSLQTAPVQDNSAAVLLAIATVNSIPVGPNTDTVGHGLPPAVVSLTPPRFRYDGASFNVGGAVQNCTSANCATRGGCTQNLTSGVCSGPPAAVYDVVYTAVDAEGNTGVCQLRVTVADNEVPVLSCPANQFISTDLGQLFGTVTLLDAPVTDNSGENLTASATVANGAAQVVGVGFALPWTPATPAPLATARTVVNYAATDSSGNTGECQIIVVVQERNDCDCIGQRNPWYVAQGNASGDPLCAHATVAGDSPCVHGTCSDTLANFTCSCQAGWTGYQCNIDIDECVSNPCQNNAACSDSTTDASIPIDAYRCACPPRFSGHDCEFLDECSYDPCHMRDSFFQDYHGMTAEPDRFHCDASEFVSSFDGVSFSRFLCVDPNKRVTGDFYCRCPTCLETIFPNATVAQLTTYLLAHPSMQLHIKGEIRKNALSAGQCVDPSLPRSGCTDSNAINYDQMANLDDGSCIPALSGCMNPNATNYQNFATVDDGSCRSNYPNGTLVNIDECLANPCYNVDHFRTTPTAPVCEEAWQCTDSNHHILNDYKCTCPQAVCGLENVVPEINNFALSIFLHREHELKIHLMQQIASPVTVGGCTCMAAWNSSAANTTIGCANGQIYNQCGMVTPCNGDTGGVGGQSWCEVIDTSTCNAAGSNWDYCTPSLASPTG
jgi:hypothetical protein